MNEVILAQIRTALPEYTVELCQGRSRSYLNIKNKEADYECDINFDADRGWDSYALDLLTEIVNKAFAVAQKERA